MMEDYEINEDTLAIIPFENKSKVYEDNEVYIINKSVHSIMEDSCEYFGSSLKGRQKGTTSLIGVTHKTPIIVEESKEIIFFPTASPRLNTCSWISLNNLKKYQKESQKIKVQFNNNKEIILDISYGIIDNQVLRATRLESTLRKRKKNVKII